MTPQKAKKFYRDHLHEVISIRRITGAGSARTVTTHQARARVTGFEDQDLTGGVRQGDRKAIVYTDDLVANGLTLPVKVGDYLIDTDGSLYSILEPKPRRVNGVLIAYELTCRG